MKNVISKNSVIVILVAFVIILTISNYITINRFYDFSDRVHKSNCLRSVILPQEVLEGKSIFDEK